MLIYIVVEYILYLAQYNSMRHFFNTLPVEIKRAEISSHLDRISLILLRHTLCGQPLPTSLSPELQQQVISHGLPLTQYFHQLELLDTSMLCNHASNSGGKEILTWGLTIGLYWSERDTCIAAQAGQLECLQWMVNSKIHQPPCPIDARCMVAAAKSGRRDILQWLLENKYGNITEHVYSVAARRGHFQLIQLLYNTHPIVSSRICADAAYSGNFEMVKWLQEKEYGWHTSICSLAIHNNNIGMLKWALLNGCPIDAPRCFGIAALKNSKETIEWLRSEGYQWTEKTCSLAAAAGHLQLLKWLRKEGCPWDAKTCAEAARSGNFEIVEWLRKEGCP
jgi:hypothetical protein